MTIFLFSSRCKSEYLRSHEKFDQDFANYSNYLATKCTFKDYKKPKGRRVKTLIGSDW